MPKSVTKTRGQVEDYERQLSYVCQKIYQCGERRIQPCWPWVLIRVLPKEQKFGTLYLPDNAGASQQNKPLWEGIVLETWKPHWRKIKELKETKEVYRESDFKIGNRVLFPSFAGLPVPFLDEKRYRLVREWTFDPNGGVTGIVHFDGDVKLQEKLNEVFKTATSVTLSGK